MMMPSTEFDGADDPFAPVKNLLLAMTILGALWLGVLVRLGPKGAEFYKKFNTGI